MRDSADLQEGYLELLPDRKTGCSEMTAGRAMLNYGEIRACSGGPDGVMYPGRTIMRASITAALGPDSNSCLCHR